MDAVADQPRQLLRIKSMSHPQSLFQLLTILSPTFGLLLLEIELLPLSSLSHAWRQFIQHEVDRAHHQVHERTSISQKDELRQRLLELRTQRTASTPERQYELNEAINLFQATGEFNCFSVGPYHGVRPAHVIATSIHDDIGSLIMEGAQLTLTGLPFERCAWTKGISVLSAGYAVPYRDAMDPYEIFYRVVVECYRKRMIWIIRWVMIVLLTDIELSLNAIRDTLALHPKANDVSSLGQICAEIADEEQPPTRNLKEKLNATSKEDDSNSTFSQYRSIH